MGSNLETNKNDFNKFYNSKPWRDLAYKLKIQANGKCNGCGDTVLDTKYLIAHHKIELNEGNIYNPEVTLNPDNIEVLCHDCHNKKHRRFGGDRNKQVYIVYGPPLSGKNTFVTERAEYGDLILDIDELWKAVSLQDKYIKPNNLRFNIFKLRDELLDQIKTRYGNWYNACIISGLPEKYERERLAKELGAEMIYIEATKEECKERAVGRPSEWLRYIDEWFDRYNG